MTRLKTTLYLKGVRYHSLHQNNRVWLDNRRLRFEKSTSAKKHSAAGFDWGNRSPGASQLALAICLEIYPKEVALEVYKAFKIQYLLPIQDDWFERTLNLVEFNKSYVEPKLSFHQTPLNEEQRLAAETR